MRIGIACSAAGAKGAFVHGVLVAFADAGLKAHLYGAASSTAIVATFAATGQSASSFLAGALFNLPSFPEPL